MRDAACAGTGRLAVAPDAGLGFGESLPGDFQPLALQADKIRLAAGGKSSVVTPSPVV